MSGKNWIVIIGAVLLLVIGFFYFSGSDSGDMVTPPAADAPAADAPAAEAPADAPAEAPADAPEEAPAAN